MIKIIHILKMAIRAMPAYHEPISFMDEKNKEKLQVANSGYH